MRARLEFKGHMALRTFCRIGVNVGTAMFSGTINYFKRLVTLGTFLSIIRVFINIIVATRTNIERVPAKRALLLRFRKDNRLLTMRAGLAFKHSPTIRALLGVYPDFCMAMIIGTIHTQEGLAALRAFFQVVRVFF